MSMFMVWMWIANNIPVWAPVVGAALSMGYAYADKTTKGHALLSFLAALLPLDLPKMKEAVVNFVAAWAKKKVEDK